MQRKTNFYCPECEYDRKRNYLTHDRGVWSCNACGHTYSTEDLQELYTEEYTALLEDAEWIKNSMIDGLDEFTQSKVAA